MHTKPAPPPDHPTPPARFPTHAGNLTHVRQSWLSRVAAQEAVAVDALSTVTVRPRASDLVEAICLYASLPQHADSNHPLSLLVESVTPQKDESDSDSDSGSSGYATDEGKPEPGLGLRKKRAPLPNIRLGTSHVAVAWPPPPHLEPDHIRMARQAAANRGKPGDIASLAAASIVREGHANAPKPATVHIVFYTVGSPKGILFEGVFPYDELVLISADGQDVLRTFAKEVLQWYQDQKDRERLGNNFSLFRFKMDENGQTWWEDEGKKRARPVSSVILPTGMCDTILDDVANFISLESKKWYFAHGLPHRRSYLFYGPPGTGKTSMIRVIASTFGLNCCYLSVVNKSFSNQVLGDALSQVPANALIVLEDVDALFNENRKSKQDNLTFSGLLNALDGLISSDGVITVMTTNHLEKLDAALIRGGRVDRRFHFTMATDEQIERLFRSFYPDTSDEVANEFLDAVRGRPEHENARAMPTLQQLFIEKRTASDLECAQSVGEFFENFVPRAEGDEEKADDAS